MYLHFLVSIGKRLPEKVGISLNKHKIEFHKLGSQRMQILSILCFSDCPILLFPFGCIQCCPLPPGLDRSIKQLLRRVMYLLKENVIESIN